MFMTYITHVARTLDDHAAVLNYSSCCRSDASHFGKDKPLALAFLQHTVRMQ
jgi:hypothetical protein